MMKRGLFEVATNGLDPTQAMSPFSQCPGYGKETSIFMSAAWMLSPSLNIFSWLGSVLTCFSVHTHHLSGHIASFVGGEGCIVDLTRLL